MTPVIFYDFPPMNDERKLYRKMIDYLEWSQQYEREAKKILNVIEKKNQMLKGATKEERKTLSEQIISYRMIYYDLMKSAGTLLERARAEDSHAA